MKEIFYPDQNSFEAHRQLNVALATNFYRKEIRAHKNVFGINGSLNQDQEESIARWVANYRFGINLVYSLLPESLQEGGIKMKWITNPIRKTENKHTKNSYKKIVLYHTTNLEYSALAVKRLFIHKYFPVYQSQVDRLFQDVVFQRQKIRTQGQEMTPEDPQPIGTSPLGVHSTDLSFIINIPWITTLAKSWHQKTPLKPFTIGGITSENYSDLFLITGIEEGAHYVYKKLKINRK